MLIFFILIAALSTTELPAKTKCEQLKDHNAYWAARGINLDPATKIALDIACTAENPCLQLKKHKEYWAPKGYDGDPLRRVILEEACHPGTIKKHVEEEVKKQIKGAVKLGTDVVKYLKKIHVDLARTLTEPIQQVVRNDFYKRHAAPHRQDVAQVRTNNDPISIQEKKHREQRFELVKKAQEKFLDMQLADDEVLDIAFSLSGGGVRASLCGLGSLVGAEKIGLLDCVMTIAALSGGTWILFPWIASGTDIITYRERFLSKWERGYPIPSPTEIKLMIDDAILVPFSFGKDVTPTDIWNAALSNVLFSEFGNQRQRITLSSLANKPNRPVPVGEAVWADLSTEQWGEEIFEFTPYEMGSRWLKSYIPAWGVGRRYDNGTSANFAPEDPIPLGTFGSAYASRASVISNELLNSAPPFIQPIIKTIMETKIGELRGGFALVNNYTKNLASSPIKNENDLLLADSGAEKILPLEPTYRGDPNGRHPDLLFLFDCGRNQPGIELESLTQHAQKRNIAIPRFAQSPELAKKTLTIFKDSDSKGDIDLSKPVVLYLPRISDKKLLETYLNKPESQRYHSLLHDFDMAQCTEQGPCGTFNFNWPRAQSEKVCTLTEFNVRANEQKIKETMRTIIMTKRLNK